MWYILGTSHSEIPREPLNKWQIWNSKIIHIVSQGAAWINKLMIGKQIPSTIVTLKRRKSQLPALLEGTFTKCIAVSDHSVMLLHSVAFTGWKRKKAEFICQFLLVPFLIFWHSQVKRAGSFNTLFCHRYGSVLMFKKHLFMKVKSLIWRPT